MWSGSTDDLDLSTLIASSKDRFVFWAQFLQRAHLRTVAEIGVYRGAFAEAVLRTCDDIERYYMVDPWKHLENWNKPANASDEEFTTIMQDALQRTEFTANRRIVLRGRVSEVIDEIPDRSLDFAYIDGDHTLRGITLDLHLVTPKIKPGGFIGGDDFVQATRQHNPRFEPTLVFPYAVYYAEATGSRIHALDFNQFLIEVPGSQHESVFAFVDHTGRYGSSTVAAALGRGLLDETRRLLRRSARRGRHAVRALNP